MDRLGLIAGSGRLPLDIVDHCRENGIELFCVLLKHQARVDDYGTLDLLELEIGQVGKIIDFFRKNRVTRLVLAGGIEKPSFMSPKMDAKGIALVGNILKNKIIGDNSMLKTAIGFLEKNGFQVLEVDSLVKNLKLEEGPNNGIKCSAEQLSDIELGCDILKRLSEFDLGQAVAVQRRSIVAIECYEGTAGLIDRVGRLRLPEEKGPILIKIGKLGQTRKADLPSLGPDTMEQLHSAGFAGAAVDCNNCLVISRKSTVEIATKHNLFLYGLNVYTV
ncbi:MAG: UDP-2,3-diacylglucosamine diphosphatase LpxI [Rickettsiales bacterium]|jgi:DUF1009 family protein|nr:UDP-2,3-diacylglucosamine diphosphatase LpxI [Rickettsiales bacterium]